MKKVMSLIAVFAMSSMLAGCYSKACEEPMPAPMPYKDTAPVMMPAQEEVHPMYRQKRHHYKHRKHHHNRKAMNTTRSTTTETQTQTEAMPAETAQ